METETLTATYYDAHRTIRMAKACAKHELGIPFPHFVAEALKHYVFHCRELEARTQEALENEMRSRGLTDEDVRRVAREELEAASAAL